MKCFKEGCGFDGDASLAKKHTDETGHETGNAYLRFKPDKPVPASNITEAKPAEGAKA